MVIDEQGIIAGSFNYTGPANQFNDENIIILGDLESTNQTSIGRRQTLAKFALEEIKRFIEDQASRCPRSRKDRSKRLTTRQGVVVRHFFS